MAVSKRTLGIWLYGMLFCVALPLAMYGFTSKLREVDLALWPTIYPPAIGWLIFIGSIIGEGLSFWQLRRQAKGLPMNAYPTLQWATRGLYGALAHPLYFFFVTGTAGLSIALQSREGLWITTPLMALAVLVLIYGYEREATYARLGHSTRTPWFGVPRDDSTPLRWRRAVAALVSAFAPWAIAYVTLSHLPTSPNALDMRMAWEQFIPLIEFAWVIYSLAYVWPLTFLAAARTAKEWRRIVRSAWCITFIGFATMLLWPNYAELRSVEGGHWATQLQKWNRSYDAPWLAFPSFHMAWTTLAAFCLAACKPRTKISVWAFVAIMAWACVATGSHAVVDVLDGIALAFAGWFHAEIWRWLVHQTEKRANAWHQWRFGSVRIIGHGIWSFTAAALGTALTMTLTAEAQSLQLVAILLGGFAGAAVWGYLIEGAGRLARPLGYFGFVGGCAAVSALFAAMSWQSSELGFVLAALATGAPLAQAIGRFRCIEQGCCHGRPTRNAYGHVVYQCNSRIVALAGLQGVPVHPTALYSSVFNVFLLLLMWRLSSQQLPWSFLVGVYLVASLMFRFVEEQYRGEPQTPVRHGLTLYQWLSVGGAIMGLCAMTWQTRVMPVSYTLSSSELLMSIAIGFVALFVMSIDFPRSSKPLSRLTVSPPR